MAVLTITAANVGIGSGANLEQVVVGQATTHAQPVYLDTTDSNKAKQAVATAEASAKAMGITVTAAAADGDTALVIKSGQLILGAILTVGEEYYVDNTAGQIGTKSELASTEYITRLGIASSTTTLEVSIKATGIQVP